MYVRVCIYLYSHIYTQTYTLDIIEGITTQYSCLNFLRISRICREKACLNSIPSTSSLGITVATVFAHVEVFRLIENVAGRSSGEPYPPKNTFREF